jgi:TorA maturation chaperone TorD
MLDSTQTALARSYTYHLFSRLYLQGIAPDILPTLRAIPELANALGENISLEELAAEHHRLFSYILYPYESYFLDLTGMIGGRFTNAVLAFYDEASYGADSAVGSPDHIGSELGLLASLCGREAFASKENNLLLVAQAQELQWRFLQTHLLQWLLPFLVAMQRQPTRVFRALADLTLDLVSDHISTLLDRGQSASSTANIPSAPDLLEDDQTRLKEIARHLVTPGFCGIFLSKEDVAELGRQLELPRGFGSRQQMTVNLMRSAARYELLPELLQAVEMLLEEWLTSYDRISSTHSVLRPFSDSWIERTRRAVHMCSHVQRQAKFSPT